MEWVSSKELMGAMGAKLLHSCSAHAQRVCKRAHAEMMRARARRFCVGEECADNVDVPAKFWWAEGHQALEQDWESGDFSTWPSWLNGSQQWRAFGVEWSKEDAEAMGVSFTPDTGDDNDPDVPSVLSGAPDRSPESSSMGLMETVAWVGLRDERAALAARWHSLDRPDLNENWVGAAEFMLRQDIRAKGGDIRSVARTVAERCASGELKAKGRGSDGFEDIPANDWLGATLFVGKEPDAILRSGRQGTGWTHVQFTRVDVLRLWPQESAAAPDKATSDVRTGDPGRPALGVQLYMRELERRASSGTIEAELADEATALLRWYVEAYPERQSPTVKTIKNRIRARHRQLVPEIKTTA